MPAGPGAVPGRVADVVALVAERLGEHAPGVLSRLGAPHGHGTSGLSKAERAARLANARAPVPEGLRLVHASWIEAALEGLPPRARGAVASPTSDPVDVWLARWAMAALPPMTSSAIPVGADALAWLARVGADQLAFALGAAAEQAIARVGEPLRAAIGRIERLPRAGQLGPRRAAIARSRGVSLDDDLALVRLASRALAPHLADRRLARLQLTRSLPRPIGIVVERELEAAATDPLADAPAWAALVAR
jgi:hypothetical protein